MSEELGPVYFGLGEEHPFLGRVMTQERPYGDATASAIDAAVQHLVDGAHDRAVAILREHRSRLDTMATTLLQQETLNAADVQKILAETVPAVQESAGD
jgi:cell division protease FtsH